MASFRLNIARIANCPPPDKLAEALAAFGLPDKEEFGVLNHTANSQAVFATIIRKSTQAVQKLDAKTKEVTSSAVEKVAIYPFAVKPSPGILEVYSGSAAGIEQVGAFLSSSLALPVEVSTIELDVLSSVEKLMKNTQRFQLRSVRISEYSHSSYMTGPYSPKFLDNEHGREFLEEYSEFLAAASVRFAVKTGKANVSLSPKACFSYSCNEDDQGEVQGILRTLL